MGLIATVGKRIILGKDIEFWERIWERILTFRKGY